MEQLRHNVELRLAELDTDYAWLSSDVTCAPMVGASTSVRCDMRVGVPRMRLPSQKPTTEVNAAANAGATESPRTSEDARVASATVFDPFAAMAADLVASESERLVKVTKVISSAGIRNLSCRAVTSDHNTNAFKRRRQISSRELAEATGVNVQPTGSVTIVTRNKPVKAAKAVKAARDRKTHEVHDAAATLINRPAVCVPSPIGAFREDTSQVVVSSQPRQASPTRIVATSKPGVLSIILPRGGNTSTSTVHSVETFGGMVMLHLERRVNARSIALTSQGARRLSSDLARSPGCASLDASGDADALIVLRESRAAGAPTIGSADPWLINLPRGGCAEVSDFSWIEPLGPVVMVHLGRRVNARRIVLTQKIGQKLGLALQAVILAHHDSSPLMP